MISSKQIKEIQEIIQYKFNDNENLKNSLIHPSILKKRKKKLSDNYIYEFERLEFLGDRVLGLSIALLIFKKFPDYNEGNLSKKFSFLVQKDFLYKIASKINLENFLDFSTKEKNNKRLNKSIIADSFESLIGAIYIDGGYNKSFSFIKRLWSPYLNKLISDELDPKSKLQELTQKKYHQLPEYKLIQKLGSSHLPEFTISLNALNYKNILAKGSSIREAEKKAAKKILKLFNEK
tara:strand:- start:161 stop:865 length:705 start_codon:yes stop_codon:yes gene_type:complete